MNNAGHRCVIFSSSSWTPQSHRCVPDDGSPYPLLGSLTAFEAFQLRVAYPTEADCYRHVQSRIPGTSGRVPCHFFLMDPITPSPRVFHLYQGLDLEALRPFHYTSYFYDVLHFLTSETLNFGECTDKQFFNEFSFCKYLRTDSLN